MKNEIEIIASKLRNVIPYYEFSSSALKLLFYKFISEKEFIKKMRDYDSTYEFIQTINENKFNSDITRAYFQSIEEKYQITDKSLVNSVTSFDVLFEKNNDIIFELFRANKLPDNKNMPNLIKCIFELEQERSKMAINMNASSEALTSLVSKILEVKPTEAYLDPFCGYFTSALNVNAKEYIGFEISLDEVAIANMLMIILQKEKFSIQEQDFILNSEEELADKIFADCPLMKNVSDDRYFKMFGTKKFDYLSLNAVSKALKSNGRAVITATASTLFRTDNIKTIREELTDKNLYAVITLPKMWENTNINLNLIILDNKIKTNSVIMIDASNTIDKTRFMQSDVNSDVINQIMNSLNGEVIEGFSSAVDKKIIMKNDFSWVPGVYLAMKEKANYRRSSEVEEELKVLYSKFKELI